MHTTTHGDGDSPLHIPQAWGPKQVAFRLGISVRHLNWLRGEDPAFPAPRMCGSLPRWDAADIEEYLRRPARQTAELRATAGRRGRGSAVRV